VVVSNNSLNLADFPDFIHVYTGNLRGNYGKLTNIFPVMPSPINNNTSIEIESKMSNLPNLCNYYGSVIRLKDLNAIYCSPKYALLAQIYRINSDGTIDLADVVLSALIPSNRRDGLCVIDLTQYDFDGYCKLAIHTTVLYELTSANAITSTQQGMGICAKYKDVLDNVFVEYKNGVTITSEIVDSNNVVMQNIQFMTGLTYPTKAGTYYSDLTEDNYSFPKMAATSMCWYSGNSNSNLFCYHVSFKSLITSAQNQNSQYYKAKRFNGYGLVCSSLVSLMHGIDETYSTYHLYNCQIDGMTTYPFNYKTDISNLKIGDLLIQPNGHTGHVVIVTGKEYINGELYALNIFESAHPFVRYKSFLNNEYFKESSNDAPITTYFPLSGLSVYSKYIRVDPSIQNKLVNQYEFDTDYSVGTIMCDRGTDSVYCISTPNIYLSLSDANITSIAVHKDGTLYKTINIADKTVTVENDLRVIDIASDITDSGYYTLIPDTEETVQESFYVPENKAITHSNGVLSVEDPENVVYINLQYNHIDGYGCMVAIKASELDNGEYVVTQELPDATFSGTAYVIYNTPYGTYYASTSGTNGV
jgi:hypothetical protein